MQAAPTSRRAVGALVGVLVGVLALLGVAGVAVAANARPDYGLGITPAGQSVAQGQPAAFTVSVLGANGWTSAVSLTVSGLPAGASAAFSPNQVTPGADSPGTSSLTVTPAPTTPAGRYDLTVTGSSGTTKRTVPATLAVTVAQPGTPSLGAAPASVSVAPGSVAAYTVTVTAQGGSTGTVALSLSGPLPGGTTATFTPPAVTLSGAGSSATSSLQVTTSATTPDAVTTLAIAATAGRSVSRSQVQLVVDGKLAKKPFSISGGSTARGLAPGVAAQPLDLVITNPDNQALAVSNLSVSVTGTSNPACAVGNFQVTQYSGPYPLPVPARATGQRLSDLGVPPARMPQLRMLDLPTVQDACKGVTVDLSYSGSATGN